MREWKRPLRLGLTLLMLMPTAACSTMTGISEKTEAAIDENALAVCRVWLPWFWSPNDTPESIKQAKENNAARLGWGCPR